MHYQSLVPLTNTFGLIVEGRAGAPLPVPEDILAKNAEWHTVLLRNFPFSKDAFVEFTDNCPYKFSTYVGGGLRFRSLNREDMGANGTLLSATGSTQGFPLALHGEMYYQKERPDTLWLYCDAPPMSSGQTTLADGREIFRQLTDESKDQLTSRRLRYIRRLTAQDWPTTFCTEDLDEVRDACVENDLTLTVLPDLSLQIEHLCSALIMDSTGSNIFINNALMIWEFEQLLRRGRATQVLGISAPETPPFIVRWEDSTELSNSLMHDISRVCESLTVEIEWQRGDVLLVDNRCILHGRRKATDRKRNILLRLGHIANVAVR